MLNKMTMNTIKERPILFSGAMVRALLAGTKTQTRRVVKPRIGNGTFDVCYSPWHNTREIQAKDERDQHIGAVPCPHGRPGDRLWVRETFRYTPQLETKIKYRADYGGSFLSVLAESMATWKPSIFMPRAASRLLLEITAVRCERLQDISLRDVRAEGVEIREFSLAFSDKDERRNIGAEAYGRLWESINGPTSWTANPWVWVVEFKVIDGKEAVSA